MYIQPYNDSGKKNRGARTRRATHSQLGEESAEDTRDIMRRVILLLPVKPLAILEYPVDYS
jgi:hypothetical protein